MNKLFTPPTLFGNLLLNTVKVIKPLLLIAIFCFVGLTTAIGQFATQPATVTNTNLSNPFGGTVTSYSDLRYNYVLTVAELTAGGLSSGDILASIGYNFTAGGTSVAYNGLNIRLSHIVASTLTAFNASGTLVYSGNFTGPASAGFAQIVFNQTNFTWNGTNNILVSVCWDRTSTVAGNSTSFNGGSGNRAWFQQATSGTGCNLTPGAGSVNVPITRFGVLPRLTSFTPTTACASSSQTIVISGKFFTGATAVSIGGTAAASFTVNSDIQITATVGSGTTGTISVTTPVGTGTSLSSLTINLPPTLNGSSVNTNCWITDGTNDYTITVQATGSSPTDIGGNTYGMLALVNYQGSNAGNHGGYYAWNTTAALLTASGYTKNQMACTGGGFVGMYDDVPNTYGDNTATLISASTSVTGNTRTVNFIIRPNATFPKLTNNSISQYAQIGNGCVAGWTETANLFTSSPARPTSGTVTVNGDANPANTIQVCPGTTIAVSQSGWNNQSGVTYFYSDNTTGFGGWAVAPDWEIISYGNITAANQVAGQTGVNNLASLALTIKSITQEFIYCTVTQTMATAIRQMAV